MGLGHDGLGGGSVVFAENATTVETLYQEHIAVPEDALCAVPEQWMHICPKDGVQEVAVFRSIETPTAETFVPRGRSIAFYEYVSGKGPTKALIALDGKARFVQADEICHAEPVRPVSAATETFMMKPAPAGPHAFRPRSVDAINRIVIHNTEGSLLGSLRHFGRPDANTSAHVVIDRDGTIYRVVEDQFAAFHSGASADGLGGFNATSLGIEVVASKDQPGFTDEEKASVIRLVDFWMGEYALVLDDATLANSSRRESYADFEYAHAAVTIHRLQKADRGTDCPKLLFENTPDGDETFFRWRELTFAPKARRARAD